MHLTDKLSRF